MEERSRKIRVSNDEVKRKKRKRTVRRKKRDPRKVLIKRILAVVGTTLGMVLLGLYLVMFICAHGPSWVARDLFVLSVKESSAGGFLAYMVCSPSTIREIEENNKIADVEGVIDSSLINISGINNNPQIGDDIEEELENEGMKPYLTENGMLFYNVSGPTYAGFMVVVTDPSRVFVGASGDYKGEVGVNVPGICQKYGAVLATNAGGFEDIGGIGDGGTPLGIVMSEGKLKYGNLNTQYNVIGMDKNNVFVIGTMTAKQAIDRGIRDAVSFGPFLIMDGKPLEVTGMGGGVNPRTAIGQRADGAMLLLIIDGRQTHSLGATMNDLVNVMLKFGAVNAANLDGGGSTIMYYKGQIYNKISSIYGARGVPTAILVR